ncbi:MAG: O-antigen ligase family protein [Bryobacterales bacterium]|nr:O-antigen ligase family protein [Bryobacterales bacterium]
MTASTARKDGHWDQIGFLLCWLLVFLIPWGDMLLLPVRVQFSRAFTLIAAAAWIPLLWKRRILRPHEPAHFWMLLFVLWVGLTVIQTAEPERGLRRVLSFGQLLLDAWIIHQSVRTAERYHKLLTAWVLGCCVCLGGVLYNFLLDVRQGDSRVSAPGFDPNDLAVTLVLGIPAAWQLSMRERSRGWLFLLYIPLAVAGAFLTASRGAAVTLAVVLLLPLSTLWRNTAKAFVGIAALGGLIVYGVSSFSEDVAFRRLSTIGDQVSARDLNGRIDIWRKGYAAFLQHPIMGVGAGGFENAIGATRGTGMAAHNTVLGVAVEHGIVGLLFFLGVVVSLARRAGKGDSYERRTWIILLTAWAIAAMSLSWENREMTWLLWGLCAAKPQPVRFRMPQIVIWRSDATTQATA